MLWLSINTLRFDLLTPTQTGIPVDLQNCLNMPHSISLAQGDDFPSTTGSHQCDVILSSKAYPSFIPMICYIYDFRGPINARLQDPLRSPSFATFVWRQFGSPRFRLVDMEISPIAYQDSSNDCSGFLIGIGSQFNLPSLGNATWLGL